MFAHKNEEIDIGKYWKIEATGNQKADTVSTQNTELQKLYAKTSAKTITNITPNYHGKKITMFHQ